MAAGKKKIAIMGIRGVPSNYGGFETCAEQTAVRYSVDHKVYVFCRKHCAYKEGHKYRGINLITLPSLNIRSWIDTLSHTFLCALYVLFRPDIKIIHLYSEVNFPVILMLRLFGKKVVVTVDGLQWKRVQWGRMAKLYYRLSAYCCAKLAEIVVTDSKLIQKHYQDNYGGRIEYIPYGSDFTCRQGQQCLEKFGLKPRKYILFVGRLVPDKGVYELITTYNKLETDIPLVIVGDDPSYTDYIKKLKDTANSNVIFTGYVFGQDYLLLNKYPSFYVSASFIEGTSPALVAAMGMGNCVLVNGIVENLETILDAGLAYEENNFDDLKAKMELLLSDEKLAAQYRSKAFHHAQAHYNWDSISKRYMDLFFENRLNSESF